MVRKLGWWGPRNEANITQLSGTNYVSTMLLVVRNFRLKFTRSLNFGMGSGRETSGI